MEERELEKRLEGLREDQENVRPRLRELSERDELSAEEGAEFDKLISRDTEITNAIETAETELREMRRDAVRSAVQSGDFSLGKPVPSAPNANTRLGGSPWDFRDVPSYGPERRSEMRARALTAVERSSRFVSSRHAEAVTQRLQRYGHDQDFFSEYILTGLGDVYADAFLRKMVGEDLDDKQRQAISQRRALARAMGLSDVTGVLVPTHLDTQLILADDGRTNPFRQVCRVETGTTNVYQSVRTSGVSHDWTAENAQVGDNAPSFANPKATAYKGTVFVPISFEAFEDARGRESEIVELFRDEIDDAEATVFVSGNGTTRPRGLITALDANTNAEVNNLTSNVFAIGDVYNLYENVPPRYRNDRTVWFANLSIINDIRQFGTDSYNTQTVQLGSRTVPAVLGHPILEASNMDSAITAAAQQELLVVGDPSTYLIYDRLGMSVELVPNLFHASNNRPSGQRGWLAHHRTGANLTVGHQASDSVVGFRMLLAVSN